MREHGILALLLSFLCPPLAVLLVDGCEGSLCVNICLTLFFFFPGLIHSWFVICSKPPQVQTIVVQQVAQTGQQPMANNNTTQPQPQMQPVIMTATPPAQEQPALYSQQAV